MLRYCQRSCKLQTIMVCLPTKNDRLAKGSKKMFVIRHDIKTEHNHTITNTGVQKLTGIFILVINQLDAQNLFYNKFISCLYMFRAPCSHRQGVKIVLYSLW